MTQMYLLAVSVPKQISMEGGAGQVGPRSARSGAGGTGLRCCGVRCSGAGVGMHVPQVC